MNFKVLGFIAGAVLAGTAVFAFNSWRHISDDDRLFAALERDCIPYVMTGVTPFEGLGRGIGVYDNVSVDARLTNGGAAILYDGRFVASWGDIQDPPLRICRVDGRPMGASTQSFEVDTDTLIDRVGVAAQALGDLQNEVERLGGGAAQDDNMFQTVVWFEADQAEDKGNRVVLSLVQSRVSSMIVVRDRAD